VSILNIYILTIEQIKEPDKIFKITQFDSDEDTGDDLELNSYQNKLKEDTSRFFIKILTLMEKSKKTIHKTNKEITEQVLKEKEKEKENMTQRLGNLAKEERQTEDLMKNHKIGNWGLGQTKALYEYDSEQYDLERGTTGGFDVNNFDKLYDDEVGLLHETDINKEIQGQAEDDDFYGDGDEMF